MLAAPVPSAHRIAQIFRAGDQDMAQRTVTQQRRMADYAGCGALTQLTPGSLGIAAATVADSKVGQLAERVSVLIAGVQQRSETDKQESQQRLEELDGRVDARVRALEARLSACEQLGEMHSKERVPFSMREVQAAIDTGLVDSSSQWSTLLAGLRTELREELGGRLDEVGRKLGELAEGSRQQASALERCSSTVEQQASGLEQLETALAGQERSLERSAELLREHEEQLQGLLAEREQDLGYGQLDGAMESLERLVEESRMASEVELQRLRHDLESLRRRSADSLLGLRDEVAHSMEARMEAELSRLGRELRRVADQAAAAAHGAASLPERRRPECPSGAPRELARRLEDAEARLSALRVRVDGQDGRLGSVADRAEAACQQAQDAARQAALQQREDILSEADCQLRILRQRVDTLGELCEELLLHSGADGGRAGGRGARRDEEDELPAPFIRRGMGRPPPLR